MYLYRTGSIQLGALSEILAIQKEIYFTKYFHVKDEKKKPNNFLYHVKIIRQPIIYPIRNK